MHRIRVFPVVCVCDATIYQKRSSNQQLIYDQVRSCVYDHNINDKICYTIKLNARAHPLTRPVPN